MGKTTYKRLKGSQSFRQRLVLGLLATLTSTPVLIEDIRAEEWWPGLRPHEVSLLCLLEKVCDDCVVEINETGSKMKYKPGTVMGGGNLVHDCSVSRVIFVTKRVFLQVLLFFVSGITNDSKDPCVDTFHSTTLPMLKRFGVPCEGLGLKIESRGSPPHGEGPVIVTIPVIDKLMGWVTYSTRVSSQFENNMIHAARGIMNPVLPDVHIFTDPEAGKSPGYGISLVAETTSGGFISADTAVSYAQGEVGEIDNDEKEELMPPENVGEDIASFLLEEIQKDGVIDSTHQHSKKQG
ncbi:hypothetical protein Pint_22194 [Pistacia integerrima]|uniref:Uncharacterized protein n=1 Tax=Pistacia integerrima TaxID=434235 RepID=A0ACC0YIN9_9ROSI|nr:hypothetical protein Pint_22194 [Pistacia integerrima]